MDHSSSKAGPFSTFGFSFYNVPLVVWTRLCVLVVMQSQSLFLSAISLATVSLLGLAWDLSPITPSSRASLLARPLSTFIPVFLAR